MSSGTPQRPPVPLWGWLCLLAIIAVFALMAVQEKPADAYLISGVVMIAAFILGVSIPPPWGGGSKPT